MIINHLRTAVRNLFRNKLYSAINIGGLAVGLAVCMTILLYVAHEHSYDRFHKDTDRMYVLGGKEQFGDQTEDVGSVSNIVAPMIQRVNPSVESYVRIYGLYGKVDLSPASNPAIHYRERNSFLFADSNFFNFFGFPLLRGDPSSVLAEPDNVVLSESAAKKYFGRLDPIGQSIIYDKRLLKVTGVSKDAPSNSSISFSFVVPFSLMNHTEDSSQLAMNWFGVGNFLSLVKLKDSGDVNSVTATAANLAAVDKMAAGNSFVLKLSPFTNNHLSPNPIGGGGSTRYLSVFTLIAGLILVLALINYLSLATARAVTRAREVGVRKAIGADRKSIVWQFYVESALAAMLAFLIALLLFLSSRHFFFEMINLHIDLNFLGKPLVIFSFLGLLLLTILIAGSYPAVLLSAYNPVIVLYGRMSSRGSGVIVRKAFTVLQFFISVTLVISTLFITQQLKYMHHADIGADRNNVVMIACENTMKQYEVFNKEVAAMPFVQQTATANYPLYKGAAGQAIHTNTPGHDIFMNYMIVDTGFIPLMKLHWKEKPASMALVMDGRHPILNEIAVNEIGYTGNATGQKVQDDRRIVGGVLKDFNYVTLAQKIKPLMIYIGVDTQAFGIQRNVLFVRFSPHTDVPVMLKKLGETYARFDQTAVFSYEFLDDVYNNQYQAEDKLADLIGVFTTITIIIACLGLFALATFSAQQRVKEIGIRKVLGASVQGVAKTLSFDFLKPVIISLFLAIPVSAWIMQSWLNKYAFRIPLSWQIFTEASASMALMAFATVLFLSIKAARANPADSLRSE